MHNSNKTILRVMLKTEPSKMVADKDGRLQTQAIPLDEATSKLIERVETLVSEYMQTKELSFETIAICRAVCEAIGAVSFELPTETPSKPVENVQDEAENVEDEEDYELDEKNKRGI